MHRFASFATVLALVVAAAVALPASPAGAAGLGAPIFGTRTTTTALTGGAGIGPSAGTARCTDGSAVTSLGALQASDPTTGWLTGVQATCSSVDVSGGGAALGAPTAAGSIVGFRANPTLIPSDCPTGSVVTGVQGNSGYLVDNVQALCSVLNADGTLGATSVGALAGGHGGMSTGPFTCPAGAVVTGLAGSAGQDLNTLNLECQSLTYQQPVPGNWSWPTAKALNANDDIDDTLGVSGEQLWYKVPVQPGSRIQIDLSNLPADYDLAVFKDIGQAFNNLTSTADLTKLSAEFAGDAFSPSVFTPSVFTPSVFTPSVFTPSVFTPSVFTPSVFTPSVFTPSVFTPSVFTPSVFTPSVFTPANFSPSVFTPSVFTSSLTQAQQDTISDAFSSAQTRSILGVSANDGTAPESIGLATWNNTGYFYLRVTGRNGSFSPNTFHLRVRTTGGPCSGITLADHATDPTIVGSAGPETLILTDPNRLTNSSADKAALATKLSALATATHGAVVDVSGSPKVAALNAQADGAAVSCPYAKNLVAQAIRDIVNSFRGNLKYVVIVGGDHVIPFFRYADTAGLGPESNYVPPVLDSSASQASLRSNDVLSQDAYGAATDISVKGSTLPIPDLAVGRLVETPAEISANVQRYLDSNGAAITPQTSLVTGYDFLTDGADEVESDLAASVPSNSTLITDADVPPSTTTVGGTPDRRHSWTATDLAHALLGSRHDITFLAGHFSANNTLAADYSSTLDTSQLATAPAGNFAGTLVFSAGCHSGYNIVDSDGVPDVTDGLDWAQAFAQQGATLVAGTGYQYGDTDFVKYGEKLYALFAHDLRYGTGAVSVGATLVQAKADYLAGLSSVSGIDQKTLLESTLFGLPMQGVDLQSGRMPQPGADPTQVAPTAVGSVPGSTLGLRVADLQLAPSLTPHTQSLTSSAGGSVTATYLSGPDGVVNNPGEPAIPLQSVNVTSPTGQVLRGVGFRSGTYTDTDGITPLVGVATTEQSGAHTPFSSPTFFPNRIATPNYFDALSPSGGGTTSLAVTPVQHRTDSSGTGTDTQRVYSGLGFQLFYSSNTSTYGQNQPGLAAPPSITGVTSSLVGNQLRVEARVVGDPSAGVQNVWVTYTGENGSSWHGSWQSLDLTQDATDSTLWSGVLTVPDGDDPGAVRFLVQAVNGVGLVGVDDNQGAYYAPTVVPGVAQTQQVATTLGLGTVAPTVAYGDTPAVSATLTDPNGNPIAGEAVTFSLGGSGATALTNSSGVASTNLPASVVPGSYPVSATFAGDAGYAPTASRSNPTVLVTKAPTVLTVLAGSAPSVAASATLSTGGVPLRQQSVLFVVRNASTGALVSVVPAFTDGTGNAQLLASALPAYAVTITGTFASAGTPLPSGGTIDLSDPDYAAAVSAPIRVPVQSTTSLTLAPTATSVVYGASLPVSATLLSDGAPLAGRTVTFALGTLTTTAVTNASGVASTTVPVTLDPGSYALGAGFAGAGAYGASAVSGPSVTVTQAPTALAVAPGSTPQDAALATLTTGGAPLAGKPVVFVLRDQRTNAVVDADTVVTDANGVADLAYQEVVPRGNTTVRAYFGSASTPLPGGRTANLTDADYGTSTSSSIALSTTSHFLNTTVIGRAYSTIIPVSRSATVSVTGLPAGLSLSRPKSGWTISGTSPRRAGWYTVAVTSKDGSGPLTTTWYVIVDGYATTAFAQPVNDPPRSTPSVFPASSAVPLRITLTDSAGVPIPAAEASAIAADGRAVVTVVQLGTTRARANEARVAPQAGWDATFTYDAAHKQFVYYANPSRFHWVAGRTYAIAITVRTDPGRLVAVHAVTVGFASG